VKDAMRRIITCLFIILLFAFGGVSCGKSQSIGVRGRLVVASTDQPFYGFGYSQEIPVEITGSSGNKLSRIIHVEQLGSDGIFMLSDLPAITSEITFKANNVNTQDVSIALNSKVADASGVVDIGNVPLHVENLVRLTVIGSDNKPVKRAIVRLLQNDPAYRDHATVTSQAGEFTFGGFSPGAAKISVQAHRDRGNEWVDDIAYLSTDCIVEKTLVTDVEVHFPVEK
jgi:hypothetical protein